MCIASYAVIVIATEFYCNANNNSHALCRLYIYKYSVIASAVRVTAS